MIAKTANFFREVRVELAKASWPWDPKEKGFKKYKELSDSTVIVCVAMLLLSGYVAFWDFILVNILTFLTTGSLHK
ncbi:MAG: preprotein translocase subunit SecE [Chthoniobacteraceae bacterium]